jgi:hypothetical protein
VARSKILRDLINGTVGLGDALFRLKVILSDLENNEITKWINGEVAGYKSVDDVPDYRVLEGMAMGTYLVNGSFKYSNAQVPLEILISNDDINQILTTSITAGISIIENQLKNSSCDFGKIVPTAYCHSISNKDLQIINMNVVTSQTEIENIVAIVKNKLVDILIELDKKYDHLDEYDISEQLDANPDMKAQVVYNINNIIYNDSIEIGDGNKFTGSTIGHQIGGV